MSHAFTSLQQHHHYHHRHAHPLLPGQAVDRASTAIQVGLSGVVSDHLVRLDVAHEGERVREIPTRGGTGRSGIMGTRRYGYEVAN